MGEGSQLDLQGDAPLVAAAEEGCEAHGQVALLMYLDELVELEGRVADAYLDRLDRVVGQREVEHCARCGVSGRVGTAEADDPPSEAPSCEGLHGERRPAARGASWGIEHGGHLWLHEDLGRAELHRAREEPTSGALPCDPGAPE